MGHSNGRFVGDNPPPYKPDPNKPSNPYVLGYKFEVHSHIAPSPLGSPYTNDTILPPADMHESTQLEYCLSHPPRAGSLSDKSMCLEITKAIRLTESEDIQSGAQIVVVNQTMVAKIYDPLYYIPDDFAIKFDAVAMADSDYTREALAYQELKEFHGNYVPHYYGSWSCYISTESPTGKTVQRPVRLILMEYIQGVSLHELLPTELSNEQRSNIMVKVIELEAMIEHRGGVSQKDIAPRNFICTGHDYVDPNLRIVLIDFNVSVVRRLALPVSPIYRWTANAGDFAYDWLPRARNDRRAWLLDHFKGSHLFQEAS
ncbi:hypothetical protein EJ05DRAFT_33688 [Pseudovirgaria hyperparasitica]|uniref:Protein kinase domain-containing protein n=1 Tax=Pseudovirgaria hyperparasitica TaxID=470096 RepID=A0A6A6WMF3_9PEZI|nr:uncharacterized protein EJ05DRAFT_33688 [Pseudovirgaria hyperparasitica]KAF2763306.1 hypothetical protein EJ05DRAFT_33688 [Pseudovirgaria hyperparasitica]